MLQRDTFRFIYTLRYILFSAFLLSAIAACGSDSLVQRTVEKAKDQLRGIGQDNTPDLVIKTLQLPLDVLPVFIIAGDNNALGQNGELSDANKQKYAAAQQNVYFLTGTVDAPVWGAGLEPSTTKDVSETHNAFSTDGTGARNGVGPEISFAYHMQETLSRPIGIIKLASDSSTLGDNVNNANKWNISGTEGLYIVLRNIVNKGRQSWTTVKDIDHIEIVGVVWAQGNADMTPTNAASYEANLTSFVKQINVDFKSAADVFKKLYFSATTVYNIMPDATNTDTIGETVRSGIKADRPEDEYYYSFVEQAEGVMVATPDEQIELGKTHHDKMKAILTAKNDFR